MPLPSYVDGASGMQKGIATTETGIKIESIEWSVADPKQYSQDIYGGKDGFAHGYDPSVTITVTGEIHDEDSGVPVAEMGTAITFANESNAALTDTDSTFAGVANTGGFYPEDITFSENRDGFRSMTISTISHPSIT